MLEANGVNNNIRLVLQEAHVWSTQELYSRMYSYDTLRFGATRMKNHNPAVICM